MLRDEVTPKLKQNVISVEIWDLMSRSKAWTVFLCAQTQNKKKYSEDSMGV